MLGVQAGFQRIIGSQAGGGVGSAQAAQGDGVIGSQGHTGGQLALQQGQVGGASVQGAALAHGLGQGGSTLDQPGGIVPAGGKGSQLGAGGGEGIGRFQRMLADYGEPLADILPGFHDIRFRFRQWDDALARDAAGRRASVAREIEWIECRRDEMLRFWQRVETGEIPRRVTHNDTKINNILFDRQGRVLCVIDLDTVLRSPCFNDFGDAIRTYANHGREDDENLDDVWLDMTMFRGFAEGYLSEARAFLTPAETDALAFSVRYITYEQVLRFLMDYLDGDTYYKIKSPDHNLVRTRAQYALLRSAEERYDAMRAIVAELAARP